MNVNDIKGFHIELTNMCTLKCPGCARTQFIEQWPQHWQNHNLTAEDLFNFLDIDLNGLTISLCGNYGDPIYHPEFLDIVYEFKKRGSKLVIGTNGSYKTELWWHELTNLLNKHDNVTFAVDGTSENFIQYRINGDWESIKTGMKIIANSNCNSTWKYIVFAFNQNDIEKTKQLSNNIGIKNFKVDYSDRYDEKTLYLKPTSSDFLGQRFQAQQNFKQGLQNKVNPKCSQNNNEHFITADGYYTPCCFTADHRFYYKNEFGKNKKEYAIKDCTITEILNRSKVLQFYKELELQPVCQFNCPGSN
jgi:wyosine [tRNA(Phe)-imidazoG37] synthetase (radical SAM superfamily)